MELFQEDDISRAINKGLNFLKKNQNSNGSICLNNDKTWDIWDTVNAILTFLEFPSVDFDSTIDKAIEFIKKSQRPDKTFHVSSIYNTNQYCMETTPLCATALKKTDNDIDEIISYILKKQKTEGYWESGIPEIYKKYQAFPSITAQVVRALLRSDIKIKTISSAIEWLIKKQEVDGSWGTHFVYYDTPFYPLHVILESFHLYGIENDDIIKKAIKFIKKTQNYDGSWCLDNRKRDKPSFEHRTSLALYSLLINPSNKDFDSIEKGIKWLLKKQKDDGRWNGGIFVGWPGKREDIFATSISIISLKKFKNFIS